MDASTVSAAHPAVRKALPSTCSGARGRGRNRRGGSRHQHQIVFPHAEYLVLFDGFAGGSRAAPTRRAHRERSRRHARRNARRSEKARPARHVARRGAAKGLAEDATILDSSELPIARSRRDDSSPRALGSAVARARRREKLADGELMIDESFCRTPLRWTCRRPR